MNGQQEKADASDTGPLGQAKLFLSTGEVVEAIRLLQDASRLDPADLQLASAYAHALHLDGRLEDAVGVLEKAVLQHAEDSLLRFNLAALQLEVGRPEMAIGHLEAVIQAEPDDAASLHGLGLAHLGAGNPAQALPHLEKAVGLAPREAAYLYDLGNAWLDLGQHESARQVFLQVLAVAPDHEDALSNLGRALLQAGRLEEARQCVDQAMQAGARWLDYMNLGHLEFACWQLEESVAAFQRAAGLAPDQWEPVSSLGVVAHDQGDFHKALSSYGQALRLTPGNPEVLWNRALTLLADGQFEQGWEDYERRWDRPDFPSPRLETELPPWEGQPGRLLLHTEQGLGDSMQFVRFLPAAREKCAGDVLLIAEPSLVRLFEGSGLVEHILAKGEELNHGGFDWHLSLMSLPRVIGSAPESFASMGPYLKAADGDFQYWANQLGEPCQPRIGLTWEGNPRNIKGLKRSIPMGEFLDCIASAGVEADYFCLQPDSAGQEIHLEEGTRIRTFEKPPSDLAQTAGLLANLDLVITVDTAVAHLAAAMGLETWLLLCAMPDWRWINGGRETLWYPHIRVYRQQDHGRWGPPLRQLAVDMAARFRS